MASTPSGSIQFAPNIQVAIPAAGPVAGYNIPVQPPATVLSYAAGTAANQIQKVAAPSGSAAATPASIDLTTIVCVDGTTGFAHWREIVVYNDNTTNVLTWDFTATNANTAMFGAGGVTAKVTIEPGTFARFSKPLGSAGYTVDSTHKIISLDPGANTIAYRVIILGD